MKIQKISLWGGVALAVAAFVMWASWPEYGKGYSEDQRRNWNEMVVKKDSYRGVDRGRAFIMPYSFSSLMERAEKSDAPEWKIDLPSSSFLEHCPMEGMSIPFLKRLVDQGDGDACLELVFRFMENYDAKFVFPELEGFFQVEMYLEKAAALGRPGADYLLNVFKCRVSEKVSNDGSRLQALKGREEFSARLDEGDFMLGKVYLYFDRDDEEALGRLNSGLRKKVEKGDVIALRNAGHLAFLRKQGGEPDDYPVWSIHLSYLGIKEWVPVWNVFERGTRSVKKVFPMLSGNLNKMEQAVGELLEMHSWKDVCGKMEIPLSVLWKAAEQGDLYAKYLWIQYSMCIHHLYSREEWLNWVMWMDDLVRGGVVHNQGFSTNEFTKIFYERTSRNRLFPYLNRRMQEERAFCFPDVKDANMISIHLAASESMQDFSSSYLERGVKSIEEKRCARQLIEKAANKGDPYAMLSLSIELIEGDGMKADAGRAWKLLSRLEEWLKGVPRQVRAHKSMQQDIAWQRWNCVSRHGDMPGMTVKEAFDQWRGFIDSVKEEWDCRYEKQKSLLKNQFEACGFNPSNENK